MKKIISIVIAGSLVALASMGLGNSTTKASQLTPAMSAMSAQLRQAIDVEQFPGKVPDVILDYLSDPQNPAYIDAAFRAVMPTIESATLIDAPAPNTGKFASSTTKSQYFACVYKNKVGGKWNCTVTWKVDDAGEISADLPDIQDHSTGFTGISSWNASITKDPANPGQGKLRLNVNWMYAYNTEVVCKTVYAECE